MLTVLFATCPLPCLFCDVLFPFFVVVRYNVCLFVSIHSRIFHSFGDITIIGEGLSVNFYPNWTLMAREGFFFSVPHLLYNGHL